MSTGWIIVAIIVLVALLHLANQPVVVIDEQPPAQTSENAVFVRMVGGRVTYR